MVSAMIDGPHPNPRVSWKNLMIDVLMSTSGWRKTASAFARQPPGLGPGDDHEVVLRRQLRRHRPEGLAQQALDAVSVDGAPDLSSDGDAEPRIAVAIRPRERVEDEVPRGVRPALPVDAV